MARLPYMSRDQLPESERPIFDDMLQRFGRIHNLHRMVAHSPLLLRHLVQFGEGIRRHTRLDPVLRELTILTVARLTHCTYEYVHHQNLALRVGVRPEQLEGLAAWESAPAFTTQERAVIRYAAEATQQVAVAATTFEALQGFLDAEQIVELVLSVGFFNMVARVLVSLEVDLEDDAHEFRYRLDFREPQPS
jgi:uncharacterized peroxidase-related enzyme